MKNNRTLIAYFVLLVLVVLLSWLSSCTRQPSTYQMFQNCLSKVEGTDQDICNCANKVGRPDWCE